MEIGYIAEFNLELNPHLAEKFKFEVVDSLDETARGNNGFGSSGR